jgi:hypothetical protein
MWKNCFPPSFNIHRISDIRQLEIHTAEPLIPDPSPFEVEIEIVRSKSYESPSNDEIPAEPIEAVGEILWSEVQGDRTDCSNYFGISLLPTSSNILLSILLSSLSP